MTPLNRLVRWTCLVLALVLVVAGGAQNPSAAVVGIVRDATGSSVPGATIRVRNMDTNSLREAVSGLDGGFTVPNLTPGNYEVMVEKPGFQSLRETSLELQVDQTARLELQLRVGSVADAVEVKAQVPLLNTENSSKGDVIVTQEIAEMPLDGRNFQDLALLVPGVVPNAQGDFGSFPIGGARSDSTGYLIDGISARRPEFGQTQVSPNLDAIQEFKLETSGYSAEYGRFGGGVINVVLKGGANQLHGTLFEFLRNDKLDARNFFATQKSELRRNQFGAMVSGPVRLPKLYNGRDRTFFLFSWESYRDAGGNIQLSRVPTALERDGDFSQTLDAGGKLVQVKDPFASNAVFPGNRIPASRFSPVSVKILPYWPLPNRPGQANNYLADASSHSPWDSFLEKVDERISPKDSVGFRYQRRRTAGEVPFDSTPLGLFGTTRSNTEHILGLNYTRLFSPTLINEFRAGLYRTVATQPNLDQGTDFASQFGIKGIATDPVYAGFPSITVTGLAAIGDKSDRPWILTTNNYSYSDAFTWVSGRHQLKFGADLLRNQTFQPYDSNTRGTFSFTGFWTGPAFGDFLMGLLNSGSRQSVPPLNYLFSTNAGVFAQDDFKISPRLTLNLGLRWEYLGHQYDKYGRQGGFIPSLGKIVLADDRTVPNLTSLLASLGLGSVVGVARDYGLPQQLIYPRYVTFAPRFGFAWRPFGGSRTVLRGGYGIFDSQSANNAETQAMSNVFPFAISQSVSRSANPSALNFADPFQNASGAALSVGGIDPYAPTQYLQSWNLTVERELKQVGAVEVAYAGSKGTHLGYSSDINRNYYSPDLRLPNGSFPRPYPQINNAITYFSFGGNSIYNSGMITLRRRFNSGFFYRLNYVYAKSIDDTSTFNGGGNGGARQIQDPRNLAAERGRSNFDIGHSFTMNFSYQVPWRYREMTWLMRGWQLAGTGRASTGQPFTPVMSGANLNLGEAIRPDRIRKGTLPNPTPERWYDLSAFPVVPGGSFRFGTSGRNVLDGPGFIGMNLSLYKNITIRERNRLQFRWEAFNAFNHPNFNLPSNAVNTVTGATITSTGAARNMQLGLRYEF